MCTPTLWFIAPKATLLLEIWQSLWVWHTALFTSSRGPIFILCKHKLFTLRPSNLGHIDRSATWYMDHISHHSLSRYTIIHIVQGLLFYITRCVKRDNFHLMIFTNLIPNLGPLGPSVIWYMGPTSSDKFVNIYEQFKQLSQFFNHCA